VTDLHEKSSISPREMEFDCVALCDLTNFDRIKVKLPTLSFYRDWMFRTQKPFATLHRPGKCERNNFLCIIYM